MTATILQFPSPPAPAVADPALLPDPRPFAAALTRDLIDRSGRAWDELAAAINGVCGTTWVTEQIIERWHRGQDFPTTDMLVAALMLGGPS